MAQAIDDEIKRVRRELGWTQAELADALGVAANTVARWERGELAPRAPDLVRLALRAAEERAG